MFKWIKILLKLRDNIKMIYYKTHITYNALLHKRILNHQHLQISIYNCTKFMKKKREKIIKYHKIKNNWEKESQVFNISNLLGIVLEMIVKNNKQTS